MAASRMYCSAEQCGVHVAALQTVDPWFFFLGVWKVVHLLPTTFSHDTSESQWLLAECTAQRSRAGFTWQRCRLSIHVSSFLVCGRWLFVGNVYLMNGGLCKLKGKPTNTRPKR